MNRRVVLLVLAACQASTTRPGFAPMPAAPTVELELEVPEATRVLADAMRADSIPVGRVEPRDGLVESRWFETPGFRPTTRRPLGPAVTQVRAWVDPGRPGHSVVTVETVYRLWADPSRPARELEAQVAESHPASVRVREVLHKLVLQFGDSASRAALDTLILERARRRDTVGVLRPDTSSLGALQRVSPPARQ
jgi:hypothetical protein